MPSSHISCAPALTVPPCTPTSLRPTSLLAPSPHGLSLVTSSPLAQFSCPSTLCDFHPANLSSRFLPVIPHQALSSPASPPGAGAVFFPEKAPCLGFSSSYFTSWHLLLSVSPPVSCCLVPPSASAAGAAPSLPGTCLQGIPAWRPRRLTLSVPTTHPPLPSPLSPLFPISETGTFHPEAQATVPYPHAQAVTTCVGPACPVSHSRSCSAQLCLDPAGAPRLPPRPVCEISLTHTPCHVTPLPGPSVVNAALRKHSDSWPGTPAPSRGKPDGKGQIVSFLALQPHGLCHSCAHLCHWSKKTAMDDTSTGQRGWASKAASVKTGSSQIWPMGGSLLTPDLNCV